MVWCGVVWCGVVWCGVVEEKKKDINDKPQRGCECSETKEVRVEVVQ